MLYGSRQRQAIMLAFLDNFWLVGVHILAMIPLMSLMKEAHPQKAPAVSAH